MIQSNPPIITEQYFDVSIQTLWDAITQPDKMRQWFFEQMESFEARVGFKTQFNVETTDRNFLHKWKITEVIPYKKIVYHWSYVGYPGESFVSFEIVENKNKTNLRLTHSGTESFPQDIPEFTRESCQAGWDYFIKTGLKEYLKTLRN